MVKICEYCQQEFWASHSYNKYCSPECFNIGRLTGKIYACNKCGKKFYSKKLRKYCSSKCFGDSNRVEKVDRKCQICEKMFKVFPSDIKYGRGRTCSRECYHKWNSGEQHHNWKGGISPLEEKLRKAAGSKPWRNAVLKRDGYKCVKCGSINKLEVDHILPWSLFPNKRFDIDNGRTLCHDCHILTPTYGAHK